MQTCFKQYIAEAGLSACGILLLLPVAAAGAEPVTAYQRHIQTLAASCAACHGTHGNSVGGSAVLAGLDKRHFIAQMQAFRFGARMSTVMHHHAKGLTVEEIEQLGLFFAAQPRLPAELPPKSMSPLLERDAATGMP